MEQLTKQLEANLPGTVVEMLGGEEAKEKVMEEVRAWAADGEGLGRVLKPLQEKVGEVEKMVGEQSSLISESKVSVLGLLSPAFAR